MQLAAAAAYRNDAQWHEEANIHVYAERRALAEEIMRTLGCTFDPTQVGMFLWGRIPESCTTWNNLRRRFCTRHGSSSRQGPIFGSKNATGISGFRFAPKKKIAEALERIRKVF